MSKPPTIDFSKTDIKVLLAQNPAMIPVRLVSSSSSLVLAQTDRLLPRNMKVANFISMVKREAKFKETESLTLSCKNKMLNPEKTLGDIYQLDKEKDEVLRIHLKTLESFGR